MAIKTASRILESVRVLEALPNGKDGHRVFKVILISEGLGNRRNMNYYGPEAIESAVKKFNGRWCYLNHQNLIEAKTLPERKVEDKAGYFKDLKEADVEEGKACAGELHCDLSESGKTLAAKLDSALAYRKDFPDNGEEYCGLSVNGDGDAEDRDMEIDGVTESVHYVTEFTEADSCDLVTTPARGGRLLEDESGARTYINEGENMNILKSLKAALAKLQESSKKATGDAKKRLEEAQKEIKASISTLEDAGGAMEADMEALCAKKEGETDDQHMARLKGHHAALGKLIGGDHAESDGIEGHDADGDGDADDKPVAKPAAAVPAAQESKRKLSADDLQGRILAVKAYMAESGLPEKAYKPGEVDRLSRLTFREAKAVIDKDAQLAVAIAESFDAPVASLRGGSRESNRGGNASAFKEAFSREA